jgi:hypothetical protein
LRNLLTTAPSIPCPVAFPALDHRPIEKTGLEKGVRPDFFLETRNFPPKSS